jgi:hypothetical protein
MYQHRWGELMTIALVLSIISLLVNIENPAGLVIVTSLASTALALMVAPGAFTNTIRSVFLSYLLALFVSVSFGFMFSHVFELGIEATPVILFVEFFLMLSATLLLFGFFDVYHPPSIGAMLTYFIDRGFSDADVIIFVPICVVFLLATIKTYIYWRHPEQFKWQDFPKEFKRQRT